MLVRRGAYIRVAYIRDFTVCLLVQKYVFNVIFVLFFSEGESRQYVIIIAIVFYYFRFPFRTVGTPNETTWPGVTSLKDYKSDFPKWRPHEFSKLIPTMEPMGIDLLEVRVYRISSLQIFLNMRPFFNHGTNRFAEGGIFPTQLKGIFYCLNIFFRIYICLKISIAN